MPSTPFLLYGATGYTGSLIARYAREYGLHPILAGRREEKLASLAKSLDLPYKVVRLDGKKDLESTLAEVPLVLHAAGPFALTAKPMMEACITTRTHYLDITGELEVFEMAKIYDSRAKEEGIMIMPGVGFDVVPTDCLALLLKNRLPEAVELKLAFTTTGGGLSHGTASTMIRNLGEAGTARKQGRLQKRPLGEKGMWVDFGNKRFFVMTIPWGDLSTAWFTTGIPDIETYTAVSPWMFRFLKMQGAYNWALRTGFVRRFFQKITDKMPPGPSDEKRSNARSLIWGQVRDRNGNSAVARLSGPDGYTLTAHSSLLVAQHVLNGNFKTGFQTPATVYGSGLIQQIPGVITDW